MFGRRDVNILQYKYPESVCGMQSNDNKINDTVAHCDNQCYLIAPEYIMPMLDQILKIMYKQYWFEKY